ncbi:POK18 protein, partial [Onychorhynchus coronatus]|nr:POK18 protein [Onychorhynchus coronatus]
RYVICHMHACITALGAPTEIKTDNGSNYTSQRFQEFCTNWGISHVTGIPHSPTGQVIIKGAHRV